MEALIKWKKQMIVEMITEQIQIWRKNKKEVS